MTDWKVTATNIYCDAVDDDVTLIVDGNWNVTCTGYAKYSADIRKDTADILKQKSAKLGKTLKCEGPHDFRVTDYLKKLQAEEKALKDE